MKIPLTYLFLHCGSMLQYWKNRNVRIRKNSRFKYRSLQHRTTPIAKHFQIAVWQKCSPGWFADHVPDWALDFFPEQGFLHHSRPVHVRSSTMVTERYQSSSRGGTALLKLWEEPISVRKGVCFRHPPTVTKGKNKEVKASCFCFCQFGTGCLGSINDT